MLQAELRILGGKHQGKAIPLSTRKFLVGREQDCQLRPNSDLVSRHHCVFSIDDYAIRLRDLGSTNGTRVNGKPLHGETILKSGDQIGIGKLDLELVIRQRVEAAVAAPTVPVVELPHSSLESVAETATVEVPLMGLGTNPNASDTSFEMPVQPAWPPETSTNLAADTAIIPGAMPQPAAFPGFPAMPTPGYPAGMPQQGFGGMPGYQQPMGFQPGFQQPMMPQQMMPAPMMPQQMGYQQPGYPQYPQQGYPQPGYGMPQYPPMQQMPYGGGFQAAAPVPVVAEEPVAQEMAVKLPPPEATGAKLPDPPPATAPGAAAAKPPDKPSNTAADIIKSYMQRRTR